MMVHPWVRFCEQAWCSPDTTMSCDLLAIRYLTATGEHITSAEVHELKLSWREHCRTHPGVTLRIDGLTR